MSQHEVPVGGDRRLMVEVSGNRDGMPVFLMHGTPGSRSGPKPRGSVSYRLGVLLISYDRPGYGRSTRHPGRGVADAARDVAAIADALGIDRFAVVGRSGGGPHALACAALLPQRVVRTAVLVSLAPANARDLNWYDGMTPGNVAAYTWADNDYPALKKELTSRAASLAVDPESMFEGLRTELEAADRRVVDNVAIRRQLAQSYTEALRDGPFGWLDDVLAFRADWGFDLGAITSPVRIWHGADDRFSPVSHAQWLARQIPGAVIDVRPGAAHFNAVEILPEILSWVAAVAPHQRDGD
ncbi:alpha/beta hydrolase [Luedemannella flava]